MADILTADEGVAAPQMGAGAPVGAVNAQMGQAARRTDYEALFTTKAKDLVKGVGHVTNKGVPLNEANHAGEILTKAKASGASSHLSACSSGLSIKLAVRPPGASVA